MADKNIQIAVIALIGIVLVLGIYLASDYTETTTNHQESTETAGLVGHVSFEILPEDTTEGINEEEVNG